MFWEKHHCPFKGKLDNFCYEYEENVNASEISNNIDEKENDWNESDNEKVPGRTR